MYSEGMWIDNKRISAACRHRKCRSIKIIRSATWLFYAFIVNCLYYVTNYLYCDDVSGWVITCDVATAENARQSFADLLFIS